MLTCTKYWIKEFKDILLNYLFKNIEDKQWCSQDLLFSFFPKGNLLANPQRLSLVLVFEAIESYTFSVNGIHTGELL